MSVFKIPDFMLKEWKGMLFGELHRSLKIIYPDKCFLLLYMLLDQY